MADVREMTAELVGMEARNYAELIHALADPSGDMGHSIQPRDREWLIALAIWLEGHADALASPWELRERMNTAYTERNRLVAALARIGMAMGWRVGLATTAIEGWDPAWHGCVYIDSPAGQLSWHFHERERSLFDGLPPYEGEWDGHSTPEKYDRLAALRPDGGLAARELARMRSHIAVRRLREALTDGVDEANRQTGMRAGFPKVTVSVGLDIAVALLNLLGATANGR